MQRFLSLSDTAFGGRTILRLLGATALFSVATVVAAADVAAPAAPAAAPADTENSGDDIVVTAERRNTSLQRTPVSVGVVGNGLVNQQGLVMVRDLSGSVASLQVPPMFSPSMSYIFIRGIGTSSPTYSSAVGIYIDDVYQARVINSGNFNLPDVEQVEVLRGPQGTLYGQNTSGGAIKIVTRKPATDQATGRFSIAAGDYGQVEGRAYLSAPLVQDVLGVSLAYSHDQTGGYTYNATLDKKVNRIHTDQARVKIGYTSPSDHGPDVELSAYYLRDRSDNNSYSPLNVPNPDPRVTYENLDLKIHNNAFLVSLNAKQPLTEDITLKSITAVRGFENDPQPWSLDGLPTQLFSWNLNLRQRQYSQELQLQGNFGKLSLTGGAIVFRETFRSNRPSVTLGTYAGSVSNTKSTNVGFYGQGHLALTDKLGVTAGLRYFFQRDTYDNTGYTSNIAYEQLTSRYVLTGLKQRTDGFTPKFGVDYQITPGLFGYASITKGIKSGGYNPVASAQQIAAIPTNPEKVIAYEGGLKFNTSDRSLTLNVAGFYNDYKDFQTALSNVVLNGTLVNGSVTVNAAKSRTYGGEVEATIRPVARAEARIAASYLEASFQDFSYRLGTGATATYDGNKLPYTSKYNASANLSYVLPLSGAGNVRANAEVKYTSRSFTDIQNNIVVPKQTYVNLDAQYTAESKRWNVFFRLKNLFDKTYATAGIPITPTIPGVLSTFYNPPRSFQIGAGYNF